MYAYYDDIGVIGAGETRPEAWADAASKISSICGAIRFAEMTPSMALYWGAHRKLPRDFEIAADGRICSRLERIAEFGI
jgi:hypothetical protein